MIRPSIAAVLFVVVAACGGSEKPAKTETTAKMSAGDDSHAMCVQMFTRQRECTDTFIPALVAARVSADKPAGIAAKDAEVGRDALVGMAMEEWAQDSTDEAIAAQCDKILTSHTPTQAEIDQGQACMAADACQPFVDCSIELIKPHWQ
jgi:hypothetical protein